MNRTRSERQPVLQTDHWRPLEFIQRFRCSDGDIHAFEGLRAPDPLSLCALWAPAHPPVPVAGAFAQSRRGPGVALDARTAIKSARSRVFNTCTATSALAACLPPVALTGAPDEPGFDTARPIPPEQPEDCASTARVAPMSGGGNVNHSPRYS